MAVIYIGIGSNIGDRQANCLKTLDGLKSHGIVVKKMSSMHETEPWGLKEQPRFINMAIEAETALSPEELLNVLKCIEKEMGREDAICSPVPAAYCLLPTVKRWGPRIIDLDILFYNDIVISMEHLKIPHPLLHKRDFVLLPLSEIAPDKIHPVLKKNIRQLKEELIGV